MSQRSGLAWTALNHPDAKTFNRQRFLQLAVGVPVAACVGIAYCFSIISNKIKVSENLSQEDITTITTAGAVASYLNLPFGMLYDSFGPKPLLLICGILSCTGFVLLSLIFSGTLPFSVVLMCAVNALINLGVGSMDTGSLMSNLYSFPMSRGEIIIIQKTFMGLGATLFSLVFEGFFEDIDGAADNSDYVGYARFVACFLAGSLVLATIFTQLPPYHQTGYGKWRRLRERGRRIEEAPTEEEAQRVADRFDYEWREEVNKSFVRCHETKLVDRRRLAFGLTCLWAVLVFFTVISFVNSFVDEMPKPVRVALGVVALSLVLSFFGMLWPWEMHHIFDYQWLPSLSFDIERFRVERGYAANSGRTSHRTVSTHKTESETNSVAEYIGAVGEDVTGAGGFVGGGRRYYVVGGGGGSGAFAGPPPHSNTNSTAISSTPGGSTLFALQPHQHPNPSQLRYYGTHTHSGLSCFDEYSSQVSMTPNVVVAPQTEGGGEEGSNGAGGRGGNTNNHDSNAVDNGGQYVRVLSPNSRLALINGNSEADVSASGGVGVGGGGAREEDDDAEGGGMLVDSRSLAPSTAAYTSANSRVGGDDLVSNGTAASSTTNRGRRGGREGEGEIDVIVDNGASPYFSNSQRSVSAPANDSSLNGEDDTPHPATRRGIAYEVEGDDEVDNPLDMNRSNNNAFDADEPPTSFVAPTRHYLSPNAQHQSHAGAAHDDDDGSSTLPPTSSYALMESHASSSAVFVRTPTPMSSSAGNFLQTTYEDEYIKDQLRKVADAHNQRIGLVYTHTRGVGPTNTLNTPSSPTAALTAQNVRVAAQLSKYSGGGGGGGPQSTAVVGDTANNGSGIGGGFHNESGREPTSAARSQATMRTHNTFGGGGGGGMPSGRESHTADEADVTVGEKDALLGARKRSASKMGKRQGITNTLEGDLGFSAATLLANPAALHTSFLSNLIRSPFLWCFWWINFAVWGTGAIFVNNMTQMYKSVNHNVYNTNTNSLYVAIMGIGSALGRIFIGYAEMWIRRRKAEREANRAIKLRETGLAPETEPLVDHEALSSITILLPLSPAIMTVACLFMTVMPPQGLGLIFGVAAFSFGVSWAIFILAVREIFAVDIGKNYNFCFTSGIAAAFLLNREMFGKWYDAQASSQHRVPQPNDAVFAVVGRGDAEADFHDDFSCSGNICIRNSMFVLSALCFSAVVVSVFTSYWWLQRKRRYIGF